MAFVGPQRALLSAGYQPESLLIFAAFTTPPTSARKALINACVVALKNAGVWAKFDVLYMFAAADSQAAIVNWINPGTYNGTATNSPVFTADSGFTGGNTKYIDTGFNPSTAPGPSFVRDSASIFAWDDTVSANNSVAGYVGITNVYIQPRQADNNFHFRVNAGGDGTAANADGSGLIVASRTASNLTTAYRNGASIGTDATASGAVNNATLAFLAGAGTYFTGMVYCGGFGSGLSSAEAAALYRALRAYLQTVAGVA